MEFLLHPALKMISLQIFCFSWPGLELAFDKYLWTWKGVFFSAILDHKKKPSNHPFPLFTGWTPPASHHISIQAPNVVPAVEALVSTVHGYRVAGPTCWPLPASIRQGEYRDQSPGRWNRTHLPWRAEIPLWPTCKGSDGLHRTFCPRRSPLCSSILCFLRSNFF